MFKCWSVLWLGDFCSSILGEGDVAVSISSGAGCVSWGAGGAEGCGAATDGTFWLGGGVDRFSLPGALNRI